MAVPVPPCVSAVGICTQGRLKGKLKGEYELEVETLVSTNDGRVPFVNFFTGTSQMHTQLGDFVGVDTGALNLSPPGTETSGTFSTLLTLIEGGSGFIQIRGKIDFITGDVSGRYSGVVCTDDDDGDYY